MPLGIDFLTDFGRFLVPKWRQVGTNIGSKIDISFEKRFFESRGLPAAGARLLRIGGPKLEAKIDQKLKPKMDCLLASIFGGFWLFLVGKLGWKIEPRANKNRFQNASKNDEKNVRLGSTWGVPSLDVPWRCGVSGTP